MSFLSTQTPVSMTVRAKSIRRVLFLVIGVPFLALVLFVALTRTTVLPPLVVLKYQLGFSAAPTLGRVGVDLRGWGWYPIQVTERTDKNEASITFVQFLPFRDPAIRPIHFFHRDEKLSDEFYFMERHYSWGVAKFVKPRILPMKEIHIAWLPEQQFFVAAPNESDLLRALSVLEVKKAD